MLLQSKETTIAYRCPVCGKFIFGMVGVFTLSGDLIKLKCDCGGSTLQIAYTADRKMRISVPCLFCPKPHIFCIGRDAFFDRDLLALSCTYSGVDACFIGSKENVLRATADADRELAERIEEAGFDDLPAFLTGRSVVNRSDGDNVDEDYREAYAQIEDVVHFMLSELSDEDAVSCGCRAGDTARYDFEFCGDRVRIFCHTCHHEVMIPMASTLDANAFLHIDRLSLLPKP